MDWYKRKPQSYRSNTWGLTLAEHGAYNLLIDYYYITERPLPNDDAALASICACTIDKWLEVKKVVTRYFRVTNAGLRHDTCDEVIDAALGSRSKDRERQNKFRNRLKTKNTVTRLSRASHGTRGEEIRLEENIPPIVPLGDEMSLPLNGGNGEKPVPEKRATRWPVENKIPDAWVQGALDTLPTLERRGLGHIDVQIETKQFLNWAISSGKRYLDWERTYQNWILNAAKRAPRPRSNGGYHG